MKAAVRTTIQIHTSEPDGDILLFLPHEDEIDLACQMLRNVSEIVRFVFVHFLARLRLEITDICSRKLPETFGIAYGWIALALSLLTGNQEDPLLNGNVETPHGTIHRQRICRPGGFSK